MQQREKSRVLEMGQKRCEDPGVGCCAMLQTVLPPTLCAETPAAQRMGHPRSFMFQYSKSKGGPPAGTGVNPNIWVYDGANTVETLQAATSRPATRSALG